MGRGTCTAERNFRAASSIIPNMNQILISFQKNELSTNFNIKVAVDSNINGNTTAESRGNAIALTGINCPGILKLLSCLS